MIIEKADEIYINFNPHGDHMWADSPGCLVDDDEDEKHIVRYVRGDIVDGLRERIEELEKIDPQKLNFATWLYNCGYISGHHDTVEGVYTHVGYEDHDTYHDDVVGELLNEILGES